MAISVERNSWASLAQEPSQQSTAGSVNQSANYASKSLVQYNAGSTQLVTVAGGATNQQVTFPTGVTTGKFVRIDSDQPITVVFDVNSNYKIQLVPNSPNFIPGAGAGVSPSSGAGPVNAPDGRAHFEGDISFTALFLNGPAATGGPTANVYVMIAGV